MLSLWSPVTTLKFKFKIQIDRIPSLNFDMDTLLHLIDANLARYLSVGDMLGLECAATWTALSDVAWRHKSRQYTHAVTRDHKRALAYI